MGMTDRQTDSGSNVGMLGMLAYQETRDQFFSKNWEQINNTPNTFQDQAK